MQIKGVTESELKIINSILEPFKNKYEFFLYGSRIKGNFRFLSDLDMMIRGLKSADLDDIEILKENFDKSNLSYIVNIVDYFNLSEDFFNLIEKDLLKL